MPSQSTVIVIEPSSSGYALIHAARHLGFRVSILSADEGDRLVDDTVRHLPGVSVHKVETNDDLAVRLLARQLAENLTVVGVLPGFEFYVPVVADVATDLVLPGLPVQASRAVRDKFEMRECARRAGLSQPKSRLCHDLDGVLAAGDRLGFPVVLKPTDAAGSVHVSLANNPTQLEQAYSAMRLDDFVDLGRGRGEAVLVEEFVRGAEFSAEGYVQSGEVTVISLTEKLLSPPPSFVELGHTIPANLPPSLHSRLATWVAEVTTSLGVDNSVFHVEFRVRDGVPALIEAAARLAGDHIVDLARLSTGVDLAEVAVRLAVGQQLQPRQPATVPVAAIRFVSEPVQNTDELRRIPGVLQVGILAPTTAPVQGPEDFRSRAGFVMLGGSDRSDVEQTWASARVLLSGVAV